MSLLSDADTFNTLCAYWSARHGEYLECLRAHALRIADRKGNVTIDDVRDEIEAMHLPMPTQIGADDRMFGCVLRACKELCSVGVQQTRRIEWARKVGRTRSMVTVYARREDAS